MKEITIKGKKYSEDTIQKALEAYVSKGPETLYYYGTIVVVGGVEFVLSTFNIDDKVYMILIDPNDGVEFGDPIMIKNMFDVTSSELVKYIGHDDFEIVKGEFIYQD